MRKVIVTLIIGLWLSMGMLLGSCSSEVKPDYINVYDINGNGWDYDDKAIFEVPIHTSGKYKLFITLRHNDDYQYSNIFIRIRVKQPDGTMEIPRMAEIKLATKEGIWLGDNTGVLISKRAYITDEFDFSQEGIYTIELTQYMRQNPLQNIEDVGIILIK